MPTWIRVVCQGIDSRQVQVMEILPGVDGPLHTAVQVIIAVVTWNRVRLQTLLGGRVVRVLLIKTDARTNPVLLQWGEDRLPHEVPRVLEWCSSALVKSKETKATP